MTKQVSISRSSDEVSLETEAPRKGSVWKWRLVAILLALYYGGLNLLLFLDIVYPPGHVPLDVSHLLMLSFTSLSVFASIALVLFRKVAFYLFALFFVFLEASINYHGMRTWGLLEIFLSLVQYVAPFVLLLLLRRRHILR